MRNDTDLQTVPAPRPAQPGRTYRKVTRKHKHAAPALEPAPAAHDRKRQCPPECCARCGQTLGPGEVAYLVKEQTVCGHCHATRQASLVAAALTAPRLAEPGTDRSQRRRWWSRALAGTRDLLYLPLTAVSRLSPKTRRRRRQAAVAPLLDHLYRSAQRA
jgi:hypothetical protein